MSLFPMRSTLPPTGKQPSSQKGGIVYYEIRPNHDEQDIDVSAYSTTLIRVMETVMSSTVLLANAVLLLILVVAHKRFATTFFRILKVLVLVIIIRTVTTIIFKLPSLWFPVMITGSTAITLIIDILSKYLCILLAFLLSLNRFSVMVCPTVDQMLFSGFISNSHDNMDSFSMNSPKFMGASYWRRYLFLTAICFVISAAVTYGVITASNLRRLFNPKIGFVDYMDSATYYEASCFAFLLVATASVCLHLMIIFHLRYHRVRMTTTKPNKVEQKMFREVSLISAINMSFTLLFVLLYVLPTLFDTVVLVSVYNVLCSIPDALIPLSVLIGSREVRMQMSDRFRMVIPSAKLVDSSIFKVTIK